MGTTAASKTNSSSDESENDETENGNKDNVNVKNKKNVGFSMDVDDQYDMEFERN